MIDHDRLFKELLTTFFVEFIELFLPEVLDYLDQDSLVFLDKELFADITAGDRHEADIVVLAKFKDKESYFLVQVETQSYSESDFAERMFDYFAILRRKYRKDIYPIAVFSFDVPQRPEPHVYLMDFPNKRVLDFDFDVIQLNRLNWRDFLNRPNPVASALMAKMKIAPEDRVKVKLECLRMLIGLELDETRVQLISGFVDTYLDLDETEKQSFQTELEKFVPQEKEATMRIVTSWMKEGKREAFLEMLNYRFGVLEPTLDARVQALSTEQLEELGKALFDFSEIADLVKWLDGQPAA